MRVIKQIQIAILMAVHNRWNMTKAMLTQLENAPISVKLYIYVTDDGSVDATHQELSMNPNVNYQKTDGNLYWAKSMKIAEKSILETVDYIMWLNNDVSLSDEFFSRILNSIAYFPNAVLVGQTCDPTTNQITYGGLKRLGRHPHRLQLIFAEQYHEPVDTFCGNIVLIPTSINSSLKGIDGYFEHGYADYDYGYRAKKKGYDILVIPGFLGSCSLNQSSLIGENIWKSLRIIVSRKYLPIRSQIRFCFRHGGVEWPIYVFAPYLRVFLKRKRFRSNRITAGF